MEPQDIINLQNNIRGCVLLVAIILTAGLLFARAVRAKKS